MPIRQKLNHQRWALDSLRVGAQSPDPLVELVDKLLDKR